MTLSRMVGVLMLLGVIALGVVWLRAEEARTARRIQKIQADMVRVRRELWSVQLAIARQKSPPRIADQVGRWSLEVTPPVEPRSNRAAGDRWARAE